MTSISLPAAVPASPFDSATPPVSPKPHRRQPSRNPRPPPLPLFSFNPGSVDSSESQEDSNENKSDSDMMALDGGDRRASKPAPLPDFKFNPGADLPPERTPSPTHPVLQEMALNQQRVSRSARPAPLPAFTFAPNAGSAQPSPSPTKAGFPDLPLSARNAGGHRRRGSEFVGGGNEGAQLISTSPEKVDHRSQAPAVSHPPRGHAHRRSQAISISDIDTSDLIKVNAIAKARAGSTPTTPSDPTQQLSFARTSPQTRQSVSYSARSPPASPQRRGSAPGARPRVGFADRVDVIPRPLSLISSETEGSSSTVRCGHSLSGSINSIASPTPRPLSTVSSPVCIEIDSPQERPKTADPATLFSPGVQRSDKAMSMINLPKRPLSASGSPGVTSSGSPPNKKKHFWFNSSNNSSPSPTPTGEKSDPMSSLPNFAPAPSSEVARPKTSPERTASIKKRKYHTWTSGIFTRKAGKRSSKAKIKRTPTPPILTRRPSDQFNEIFDADDTIVIREPSPIAQRTLPRVQTLAIPAPIWNFEAPVNQVTSPILDLDAALGPFGSDEKLSHETVSRSAAARIAKLHSSERRGTVDAFGAIHRRAESAPAMPATSRPSFSVQRMGSNASLAEDVFDEEEEDNFLAGEITVDHDAAPLKNREDDASSSEMQVDDQEITRVEPTLTTPRPKSMEGLGVSMGETSADDVVIVDSEDDIAHVDARSSKSTIEAPIFDDTNIAKRPASSPMPFAYPAPQSHYASSTEGRTTSASMISSPDPEHVTFDNFPRSTRYLGEPSPDLILRASNDDLPSLSDSLSSGALPRISSSANTRSSVEQRSQSVLVASTSKANNPNWKRASLASLNRLIPGSSHGSKLKFETVPEPAQAEKSRKKTNRISKLMHFWRSKEKGDV